MFLPKEVRIKTCSNDIVISSRSWQVSSFCLGRIKNGYLEFEPSETIVFKKYIQGAKTFLDIGANVGYYSLIAARCGLDLIYAFEIDKSYSEIIKKNIKLNSISNIQIISEPVGDGLVIEFENFATKNKKQSLRLDDFCKHKDIKPDFIKMDIEGAEYDALMGMSDVLQEYHPTIMLEILPHLLNNFNRTPQDIIHLLKNYHYKIIPILKRNMLNNKLPFIDSWSEYKTFEGKANNFLAVYKNEPCF